MSTRGRPPGKQKTRDERDVSPSTMRRRQREREIRRRSQSQPMTESSQLFVAHEQRQNQAKRGRRALLEDENPEAAEEERANNAQRMRLQYAADREDPQDAVTARTHQQARQNGWRAHLSPERLEERREIEAENQSRQR